MLQLTGALRRLVMIGVLPILSFVYSPGLRAQSVEVRANDIGGVVRSPKGPEAGVWVIAETTDLPTKFARIVVTDDQGRYRHPRSAEAPITGLGARLWPGRFAEVRAQARQAARSHAPSSAPNDAAAAQYYPAIYWYSMLKIPPTSDFGGNDRHSREDHAERLAASR